MQLAKATPSRRALNVVLSRLITRRLILMMRLHVVGEQVKVGLT